MSDEGKIPGMPPEIAKAIMAVKKQIRQLGADERNEHARYNYVSVDKFYAIVGPLMSEAGLALLINEAESEVRVSEGERKTPWLFCRYELTFLHESGAMSTLPMSRSLAMPINGPQSYGAAQSYIEKQFLRQVFKVPTGERDADETAQDQIAPAAASRGRTAQQAPPGANSSQQRSPATSAPAAAASAPEKDEANKRWKELAHIIDNSDTIPEMESLVGCPAWEACKAAIINAEVAAGQRDGAENVALTSMDALEKRIARRRGLLLMEADATAPLPI